MAPREKPAIGGDIGVDIEQIQWLPEMAPTLPNGSSLVKEELK
jgi:hypothetical protein